MSFSTVLRPRSAAGAPNVTSMELFFDLVYVFAITQLSDLLFASLSLRGAVQTLVLFTAVWWAWNYTAWATNWIDPERPPVALLMIVLMVISLVMSAAIPRAFAGRGLPFAAAYVSIQVVRSGFMVLAFRRGERMRRNYAQLLAWSAIAGVVWLAGAFVDGDGRIAVWVLAIVLDVAAPVHGFRLPGVAPTPIEDWTLAGSHLAERCQLVLMIALGESVLRVGLTFSMQRGSAAVDASFVVGFIVTASLWATYFLRHAERGAEAIAHSPADAARLGRAAYAYAHAIMVAGVIVTAVAVRLTIADPGASVPASVGAAILGGPAIYLAGLAMFKRSVGRGSLGPLLAGLGGLLALTLVALAVDRLVLSIAVATVLAALVVGAARAK